MSTVEQYMCLGDLFFIQYRVGNRINLKHWLKHPFAQGLRVPREGLLELGAWSMRCLPLALWTIWRSPVLCTGDLLIAQAASGKHRLDQAPCPTRPFGFPPACQDESPLSLGQKPKKRPRRDKNPCQPAGREAARRLDPQTDDPRSAHSQDVASPYEFIGFGAMAGTKPYEFIGFGAMEPHEFIWRAAPKGCQ
jgi:hypothetical protein